MTRRMEEDQDAFRAVITTTHEQGSVWYAAGEVITEIEGPYATEAHTKARITRAKNEAAEDEKCTVTGRIQRATAWEDVPAATEQEDGRDGA